MNIIKIVIIKPIKNAYFNLKILKKYFKNKLYSFNFNLDACNDENIPNMKVWKLSIKKMNIVLILLIIIKSALSDEKDIKSKNEMSPNNKKIDDGIKYSHFGHAINKNLKVFHPSEIVFK